MVKRFEEKLPPLSSQQIAKDYKLPIRLLHQILNRLVEVELIIEVFNDHSKKKMYQPAFDINQLTLKVFFEKLEGFGSEFFVNDKNVVLDNLWVRMEEMWAKTSEYSAQKLIKDL